jgi:hypothetical protein
MYSFRNHSLTNEPTNEPDDTQSNWYAPQEEGVSVHTGFPNPAIDATAPELDLNRLLIKHSAGTYLMQISGNEWRHLGIFNGDIAIVDRALPAQRNDTIIWWHDGDWVISPRARMRPDATVWGVVTATIHQLVQKEAK